MAEDDLKRVSTSFTIAKTAKGRKSFRIEVKLFEPDADSFPEYNFRQLLVAEKVNGRRWWEIGNQLAIDNSYVFCTELLLYCGDGRVLKAGSCRESNPVRPISGIIRAIAVCVE